MKLKATLRLENGMEFHGWSFGCPQSVSGEVVFNTAMVGYPEQLTDPTYSGQILCLTYPLIGNYGVPSEELLAESLSKNFESDRIHPKGLVIFHYCEDYSNWEAEKSLEQWMVEQGLTGTVLAYDGIAVIVNPENTVEALTVDLKWHYAPKHIFGEMVQAVIDGPMAKDERGRRNALVTWAERARRAGADMIVVPQVIVLHERVGGEAGAVSAAAVNEDFYLIDARKPEALLQRSHFAEEQQSLVNDLTQIGSFFRRGGKWVSDIELAGEGMDKAVGEMGL